METAALGLSHLSARTPEQPISHFMKLALETPGLISLAAGFVDEESLPATETAATLADMLGHVATARVALQYGTTQGYRPLRQKILDRLTRADGTDPEAAGLSLHDVVVTTGSQQLLYMLAEVLLDPGDLVITEAPSYFVYHATLQGRGVEILPVRMDESGLDLADLEAILTRIEASGRLNRLKMIYTVDYFQNPSGRTLARERRGPLVELVRRFSQRQRILILEDAAYRELRFQGLDLPSIKSFDRSNEFVIYTSTFSKPCAPGFKTGFGVLPRGLMEPLLRLKGNHDFGSSNLNQLLIDQLLTNGVYDRHAAKLREVYRAKCRATLDALEEHFAPSSGLRWTQPDGGLYVWLTLPEAVETGPESALMRAALHEGVLYIPGEFCHVEREEAPRPRHEIRLCYGVASIDQIREGIARLARALARIGVQNDTSPADLAGRRG